MREEMIMAVETAKDMLQMYVSPDGYDSQNVPYPDGLCGDDTTPLNTGGTHHIECMLPPICDKASPQSEFSYKVESENISLPLVSADKENGIDSSIRQITFTIKCNGYEL